MQKEEASESNEFIRCFSLHSEIILMKINFFNAASEERKWNRNFISAEKFLILGNFEVM